MQTRKSAALANAQARLIKVRTVDAKLVLGDGTTLAGADKQLGALDTILSSYNGNIATAAGLRVNIQEQEKGARTLHRTLLTAVGDKYGLESEQYEAAGGTRPSTIRRDRGVKKALRLQQQKAVTTPPTTNGVTAAGTGAAGVAAVGNGPVAAVGVPHS